MPFRRLGARYLEVHILGNAEVTFFAFGLRPVEYPTKRLGSFQSSDGLANRVNQVAVRTLELCRHEHYEDCPWREQSLYAYDSRLQALCGYHAFGDYDFPRVSFSLLGKGLDETGLLELIAPGRSPVNAPSFTFTWIAAIAEHWLYSGKSILFDSQREGVELILSTAISRKDSKTGLFHPPEEKGCWHFYEWTPGLSGNMASPKLKGTHHAAYNLHLLEALRCYAWMLEQKGLVAVSKKWNRQCIALRAAIHRSFWDPRAEIYRTERLANGKGIGAHTLIQSLALCEGIVPPGIKPKVLARLNQPDLAPCTLSATYYHLRAALNGSPLSRSEIQQQLSTTWEKMIFSGATSLWETGAGGNDFDFAGSLCHGWSALPVYYYHTAVLGISPLSPGFKRFSMRIFSAGHHEAQGKIPTPFGAISVHWIKTPKGLEIEAKGPKQCVPELSILNETPIHQATYNGTTLRQKSAQK
jgi:hypothetical protein